jgi:recombination protein RecA
MANMKEITDSLKKKYPSLSAAESLKVERVTTGSLILDHIFGGGLPKGRIVQLFGPASGGKSAIALQCAGLFQKEGKNVLYIDAEGSMDKQYALETFGFDCDDEETAKVIHEQGGSMAYSLIETFINEGVDLVILDSTDALFTEAEGAADFADHHIGQMARLNSKALKRINEALVKNGGILILISQIRDKIGSYGGGETTSGGHSIPFYSSIRARISREEFIKQGDKVIGQKVKIKTHKNKCASPFREGSVQIFYNQGLDLAEELVLMGVETGRVKKAGAWFTFDVEDFPEEKFQGSAKMAEFINGHPDLKQKLFELIAERMVGAPELAAV